MHLWITSAAHAIRFRPMWGTIPPPLGRNYVPSGARLRQVGHDSATARKVPHFPAESCPTSQRNAAPLQTESVPHFDRNPHLDSEIINQKQKNAEIHLIQIITLTGSVVPSLRAHCLQVSFHLSAKRSLFPIAPKDSHRPEQDTAQENSSADQESFRQVHTVLPRQRIIPLHRRANDIGNLQSFAIT